jgi:hypothetical protein
MRTLVIVALAIIGAGIGALLDLLAIAQGGQESCSSAPRPGSWWAWWPACWWPGRSRTGNAPDADSDNQPGVNRG